MSPHPAGPGNLMTIGAAPDTARSTARVEFTASVQRHQVSPIARHRHAVGALYLQVARHVRERRLGTVYLGPLDVVVDETRALVLQPDLLFVSGARARVVCDQLVGAPDLVVDVQSGRPCHSDLHERVVRFLTLGVREVWVLYQLDQRMEIVSDDRGLRRRSFEYCSPLVSTVLPDFTDTPGQILYE